MLCEEDARAVGYDLVEFGKALDKTQRNLQENVKQLWMRAIVLNPFLKSSKTIKIFFH